MSRHSLYLFVTVASSALLVVAPIGAQAPSATSPSPAPGITLDGKGVTINGTDGITKLNLRFRVQQVASATSNSETDFGVDRTQIQVRRMRIRMEGILKDPRLKVNVQLAFSRGDLDEENTGVTNVVRDAYVTWQFTPHLSAAFGQAKLPGNRQRLVSSSELQSPDRSPSNQLFTVDRDVGAFVTYANNIGRARYQIRGAVTSGEGRNPAVGSNGLAYTTRWEFLPLGAFTNNGDYVEGDQSREPTLKLSFAGGVSRNDRTTRVGGQLGPSLYAPRSMTTYFADVLMKRRGMSVAAEYHHRLSPDPITRSGTNIRHVYAGEGVHVQTSWLLPQSSWEPMLRFTAVTPAKSIQQLSTVEALQESALGVARYVNGHRIKMNGEFFHTRYRNVAVDRRRGEWTLRLGAEVGI